MFINILVNRIVGMFINMLITSHCDGTEASLQWLVAIGNALPRHMSDGALGGFAQVDVDDCERFWFNRL